MMEENQLIRFDWAAKRILRDKANFDVLEGLISVLTHEKMKIVSILESESNQDTSDDKFNRVDIMAKNDREELIIIEIQLSRQVHYLERILFGVGKALTDHLHIGEPYEKVKKVYSISILYFDFGKGEDYIYHGQTKFIGLHTHDEFTLSDRDREFLKARSPKDIFPEYYLIRVNEFNKIASTPIEEWIEYLKTGKVRPDTTVPGLKEAGEKLSYLNMSPEERANYNRYLSNLANERETLNTARAEGMAEGIAAGKAEGIAEGKAEGIEEASVRIAGNLLRNGISKELVAQSTGLASDVIDEIAKSL